MKKKVALLGIYHESNTFLPNETLWEDFQNGHLLYGEDIRSEYENAHHEIGGIIEVFDQSDVEIVPLFFAEATPGGTIIEATFNRLIEEIISALKDEKQWAGVMYCAHGAAVAEGLDDMDGYVFSEIRKIVGKGIPVVVTLDPHANVSHQMILHTDALISYATNPHLDQRQTGEKAAALMLDHLSGRVTLTQSLSMTNVSISIEQQATSEFPCDVLYKKANEYLKKENVLSVSVILGFPYSDVEKMGSSFIAVTDNDFAKAQKITDELRGFLENEKSLFVGDKIGAEEAVRKADQMDKPVLLLDMGDNVGGGSPGDSTILLKALLEKGHLLFFVCIYDPPAVSECMHSGEDTKITTTIGGKTDHLHGTPVMISGKILKLAEGIFSETEPRHGGQVNFDMGKIAIVQLENGSVIMLTSKRIPPFSLKQLTDFEIEPGQFDVLIAKGVQAPLAAYGPVSSSIIRVNTPGVTCADVTQLKYLHRRRPLFPFETW